MLKLAFLVAVIALFAVASASELSAQENPLACSVCQLVIQFVEAQAASNATIDKINAVVNKVCSALRVQDWCAKNLLPLIPGIIAVRHLLMTFLFSIQLPASLGLS